MTNGLDLPIIINWMSPLSLLGALGDILYTCVFISFFDEIPLLNQTEWPLMGRRVLRRHIWGYTVCLCAINRTLG